MNNSSVSCITFMYNNLFTYMRALFSSQKYLRLKCYQKMEMVQYLHNFFKIACWTSICIRSLYNTNIQTFSNLDKNNDNCLAIKGKDTNYKSKHMRFLKDDKIVIQFQLCLSVCNKMPKMKIYMNARKKAKILLAEYYLNSVKNPFLKKLVISCSLVF